MSDQKQTQRSIEDLTDLEILDHAEARLRKYQDGPAADIKNGEAILHVNIARGLVLQRGRIRAETSAT